MARWFVDRSPQRGIPSVSLRRLLPEARFVGCRDWEVSGCTADSRRLDPGQIYVAIPDRARDGHDFVGQALERGAAGVVVERPCPEAGRLQVVVPDAREALARLCQALAGDPSRQLRLVGVAGRSGKTATGLFVRSIFEAAGERFGMVGPLGWSDGLASRPVGRAGLDAEGLARMLAAMVDRGCAGGVVGIADDELRRREVEGIGFDRLIVTDLADPSGLEPEELTQLRRRRTARLVRAIEPGGAVIVNADDPGSEVLGGVNLEARRVAFGFRPGADVTARIEGIDATGSTFRLLGFDLEATVRLGLIGSRHVRDALAAAALARSSGLGLDAVVAGLEAVDHVPSRLEAIDEGQPFQVRVDGSRTPAGLRRALAALGESTGGAILCVLGAEGLGDRPGRHELASAAEEGADRVILTTDNPRTEDPDRILDDLLSGFRRPGRVQIEPDRRLAIESALGLARPGDAVLIAGKGRETFQILADRAVSWSDRDAASRSLRSASAARFGRTSA